jgi:c-di-GMP-binding flagellar brake protein YcgR
MGKEISKGMERRNYLRIDTEVPVRFKISWANSGKVYSAITKNISHSGICLEILHDQDELIEKLKSPPEWPTLEVAPSLPDVSDTHGAEDAWIISRLNWTQKPTAGNLSLRIGLDFVEMADEIRKKIYNFVVGQFLSNYNLENV